MNRRTLLSLSASAPLLASGCAAPSSLATSATATALQGTGDLGVVIERAQGALTLVNTSRREAIGRVTGLGDLSHASV
ncbi:MAG: protein nirF, partial [Comamonadaceae bacterium]|nr:protein nirF [Comamonadaceae bacterium]